MKVHCIGGPLHGQLYDMPATQTFRHTTCGDGGEMVHIYRLEKYVNHHRHAYFLVHPDATDAQVEHALGLADI